MSTRSPSPSEFEHLKAALIETILGFPAEIRRFALLYLAGASITEEDMESLVNAVRKPCGLEAFFCKEFRKAYPGKSHMKRIYTGVPLKRFLFKCANRGCIHCPF